MSFIRFIIALWIGKLMRAIMRALGRNATYLPGAAALRICPEFLARAGKPEMIISVTGTNGKTTVCNLIIGLLTRNGVSVLHNRLGSNTVAGIAASLLSGCKLTGKSRFRTAVFETDERTTRLLFPHVIPNYLVITNLFSDSIMRNAHPEFIMGVIENALPNTVKLILNCDDPLSSRIAPRNARVYFGVDRLDDDVTECVNRINDMRLCPECDGALVYDYRRYHHIGRARCPSCGFRSPTPDYRASRVDFDAMTMTVSDADGECEYALLSDSVFNAYNQLTAVAVMRELGYEHAGIRADFDSGVTIPSSRYNEERAGDVTVIMQMAKGKNALACSRVFDYVSSRPGEKELILIMNDLHDAKKWSENTSWLYDCDFEFLRRDGITRIVAAGPRALDYYYRLLLAGVPEERLRCSVPELDAPAHLEFRRGGSVYILYGADAIELAERVSAETKRVAEVSCHSN